MTNFATSLRAAIAADEITSARGRTILHLIDGPRSPRRTLLLARLERHARAALGPEDETYLTQAGAIDWSAVDWGKVLQGLLDVLLALLPLLSHA